jgi:hypothetical protein
MTAEQARLWPILDRLDVEDVDQIRADLIDAAIGCADRCPTALSDWKAYR